MPQNPFSRRALATGAVGAVALCMAAAGSVPASAAPDPGHHREGAGDPARSVASALRLMSTQEKVGQLFVQNVYGSDATTPDPRNVPLYGVASPAEAWTSSWRSGSPGRCGCGTRATTPTRR